MVHDLEKLLGKVSAGLSVAMRYSKLRFHLISILQLQLLLEGIFVETAEPDLRNSWFTRGQVLQGSTPCHRIYLLCFVQKVTTHCFIAREKKPHCHKPQSTGKFINNSHKFFYVWEKSLQLLPVGKQDRDHHEPVVIKYSPTQWVFAQLKKT